MAVDQNSARQAFMASAWQPEPVEFSDRRRTDGPRDSSNEALARYTPIPDTLLQRASRAGLLLRAFCGAGVRGPRRVACRGRPKTCGLRQVVAYKPCGIAGVIARATMARAGLMRPPVHRGQH